MYTKNFLSNFFDIFKWIWNVFSIIGASSPMCQSTSSVSWPTTVVCYQAFASVHHHWFTVVLVGTQVCHALLCYVISGYEYILEVFICLGFRMWFHCVKVSHWPQTPERRCCVPEIKMKTLGHLVTIYFLK
jgi:hypothetical protein